MQFGRRKEGLNEVLEKKIPAGDCTFQSSGTLKMGLTTLNIRNQSSTHSILFHSP